MIQGSESPIVIQIGRLIAPFIQLFGLYVIFHGHYGPGGGFQGGAMLAASVLLVRLCAPQEADQLLFKQVWSTPLAVFGALVFVGTGLLAMMMGGMFLDYGVLPFGEAGSAQLRSSGILVVEIGIGIAVMATLVSIFDSLSMGRD